MAEQAFWRREDGVYYANQISAGTWREDSLLGRAVCGLLAHEIERCAGDPDFVPARFTAELFGFGGFGETSVQTRVLKGAGRVRLVEAELLCDDVSRARAICQLLRRSSQPQGRVWSPPSWNVPGPEGLPDDKDRWRWRLRYINGDVGHLGRKQAWMIDYRELVEGTPLTPFTQAALAADFVSPFCHGGDNGVEFINTEVTLYLHRMPRRGWIGLDVEDHQSSDGIAVGHAKLYDQDGPIGFSSSAAIAQRRSAVSVLKSD